MPDKVAPGSFDVSKLSLHEAHLLQLTLDDVLPVMIAEVQYQFKTACSILFSPDQPDLLRVNVQVSATARPPGKGKVSTKASVKLTVAVIFHYSDLTELREQQALPVGLGWTAVSIAYSTIRGIMQARLAGTSFGGALLPIVSPQQLWHPPTPSEEPES
ncbi:MAG: hypothetical protein EOO60_06675 [Hymenobacter sp.]|nr:MAG: hypothetical protein EOO60_06675 [Hymenobacter sp.]